MHDDDVKGLECEFSKFLISRRPDRAFQELSLKKIPKKILVRWTLKFTTR